MTFQSMWILHKLRKVQPKVSDQIMLDVYGKCVNSSGNKDLSFSFEKHWHFVLPLIGQLSNDGYLKFVDFSTIQLTEKGFYYLQSQFRLIASFILKSVLVPIGVAFVTTLITLALSK